jgi:hypothetical protein
VTAPDVDRYRAAIHATAALAVSTNVVVLPVLFTTWVEAIGATSITAWRIPDGYTVLAVCDVSGRHVTVATTFPNRPPFLTSAQASALPSYDGPLPGMVFGYANGQAA